MLRHSSLGVILAATCWAGRVEAQAECQDSETLGQCWTRLSTAAAVEESEGEGEEQVAEKSSGIPSLGEGLGSSLVDFLPILAGAIGLTQTTTEEGGAAFETNLLLPLGASSQRVKLQALLREPTVYQPLLDALPDDGRSEVADSLGEELADFDDVRLTAAWNFENATFGRSFVDYRLLYSSYFSGIVKRAMSESEIAAELREAFTSFVAALGEVQEDFVLPERAGDSVCQGADIQPDAAPMSCFRPEARARVEPAAAAAARLVMARSAELHQVLADEGFYEFTDLVNNQPQLQAELGVDLRQDLVGPNSWALKLRYEGGFSNVNGLRGYCRRRGITVESVQCLRSYLDSPGRRNSIRRGDRFALSAEFGRRADYMLTSPVALQDAGSWHATGSAALGRYLAVNVQGDEVGRIDLASSYVYYHDDPERQSRFVFSVTYTQRITAAMSIAAGVSYASRPEFLEEVDKKVSANFGLRYKFLED